MSIPFSLVKQPLLYPTLDPTHQYVKASNIVRHGDGSGNVNGVQTYAVKMLANQGTCGVTVQALSGQNIITAFTLSRDALLTWINSAGSNTTNIVTQTVGAIPYNKVLDSPTNDQYAWFAIGVDGHINTATPFPDNTYSYSISGNFLSPESIMKYENGQGAPKTGTFLNPSLILPNSENTFNSIYGDCISGSYYMTFDVSANIQKTITITPSNSTPVGLAISSSKSDLSSWIYNGGVGSLTDGGSYVAIGGAPLDIPIVLYEPKTMYAVYYNPGDIGGSTCQTGIPVTITSAQDIEQGSNLGTFANPYIIANNLAQSSATQHDFSQGECTKGAVYYELLACASPGYLSVGVSRGSTDYDMGVAIDADKNNLANYLRTGNSGLIANVVTISNGMGDQGLMSMVIPPSDHTYYIMIFDWAALGNEPYNTCANFDRTFTVFTEQLNCGGGGSGADGTYNHPFVDSQTWGTYRVHKEGDCSQGLTWFTWGYWCNNAPVSLGIEPQNGQNVGVAWGTDQAAVLDWVNANGSGGGGGGGGGVVHHMTTNNDGTYVNYSGYGVNSQIYAVVYLPDSFPSDQCFNTDTYLFGMNRNYCEQFEGSEGGYVGQNTNPFVIANNQNMSKLHNAGECAYGSVFFQVDVCQTQVFTITVSNSPRTVGIAWATDIVVLYNWITSGGESSGVNLGSYDGGFQSAQMGGTEASFSPATNNVYYFVVYDVSLQNTCSLVDQSFDIATSQSSCDGANGATGSYDSPITVGSTDNLSVGANYGNCFSGETFFTMQMCPNISGSVIITPSSNSYPQAIFYASNKSVVKQMADYYVSYGGGIGWGGYYDEGYNTASSTTSSPLVTIIPSHNTLKTMYFALTDRYPAASIPRCSRTGNVGVTTFQSCPIVNIGGTANISGAKRYNFDPFNYQSTIKTGVTLVTGDLGVAQTVNFLYSPMLIIDHPDEYPTITCSNISVVLYGNDVDGTTRTLDTQSTIKTEVILKNNKAIIKPTITNELLFNSANFYTGLAQTTYTTNIGTIIRNQVINVGDRFDASREQYAYVTSVSGNVATVFIPVVDESVHTLLNTEDVTSYTYNSPNSYVITFNKTGVITLPFNRAGKGTQSIKVKL